MKGIVFNIVEEVVTAAHGDGTWDVLLDDAGLDGVFSSLGDYDDASLTSLVDAASFRLKQPPAAVLRWIARAGVPRMRQRWPHLFAAHASTLALVRGLNGVIHPEVRKLYSGARCPHFDLTIKPDGSILLGYRSPRRLCAFAHGLIEGVAIHYHEEVDVEHISCMHEGAPRCELALRVG